MCHLCHLCQDLKQCVDIAPQTAYKGMHLVDRFFSPPNGAAAHPLSRRRIFFVGGVILPSAEQRISIGRLTIHLQCNLLSFMFGFALFRNCASISVGPLYAVVLLRDENVS